jgi:hypothetical protein
MRYQVILLLYYISNLATSSKTSFPLASVSTKEANKKLEERFINAAKNGRLETISQGIIIGGFNIDCQDENGNTALMTAIEHDHFNISKLLIDYSANVDLQNNDGSTALIIAAKVGDPHSVNLLIEDHANVKKKDKFGKTALHYAIKFREKAKDKSKKNDADWCVELIEERLEEIYLARTKIASKAIFAAFAATIFFKETFGLQLFKKCIHKIQKLSFKNPESKYLSYQQEDEFKAMIPDNLVLVANTNEDTPIF